MVLRKNNLHKKKLREIRIGLLLSFTFCYSGGITSVVFFFLFSFFLTQLSIVVGSGTFEERSK